MSITLSVQTFATDLLNTVDLIIGNFVQTGYQNLVQNNQSTITLIMTFYIAWLGYKFTTRTLTMEMNAFAKHIGLLIMVYALITQWQLFYLFFYNIFTNEPAQICQTMINSYGNVSMGGETTADALNSIFYQGIITSKQLFHSANTFNWWPGLDGAIVLASTCVDCLLALALLVYAKMAMAIVLFLGPIFIIFLLWDSTRGFFDKWLQKLVNYALIPIVTCGICMLTLSLANVTLPAVATMANNGNPIFTGVIPFLGISVITVILFYQIPTICAGLSGGVALASIGLAIPLTMQALKMSGLSKLGKNVGNRVNRGATSARNSISDRVKQFRAQSTRDNK